jgi:hypothetical protein
VLPAAARLYKGTGISLELAASIIAGIGLDMGAGLSEHQGRSTEDTVLDWLATRQALLVLDNCEHRLGRRGRLAGAAAARRPGAAGSG